MFALIPIIAFVAACIWLAVRIVNPPDEVMKSARKQPGVAFWATVVAVVVLVGYPLSLWPALWVSSRIAPRETPVLTVYRPLAWTLELTPDSARRWIGRNVLLPPIRETNRNLVFSGKTIFFTP